ncbi:hypothetical protein PMIN06_010520 [Paraphaeosphaeria minitans]
MAPRDAAVNLSFTVDSASEDESMDELNALPTPDSNTENKAPGRRPGGKAAQTAKSTVATKAVVISRTASRRASENTVLAAKKQGAAVTKKTGARSGRKALAEQQHETGNETEEVDEFDPKEDPVAPIEPKTARRGRPPAKAKATAEEAAVEESAPKKRGRKAAEKEPAAKKETKAKAAAKPRAMKRAVQAETYPIIPETQPEPELEPMDIEPSMEIEDEVEEVPESLPEPQKPVSRRAQQTSRAARQISACLRRAGSVSDTDRDPILRRKVGDLTKKLEAMTMKYENLKEEATLGKESNFDTLKRRMEQSAKDQDAVIKALRQQITEMQSRTAQVAALKKDLAKAEKENARLVAENQKTSESLAAARKEKETLSTKLAAARSTAPAETKNVPGSAAKAHSAGVVLPGQMEAAKKALFQDQKVELYSDLTNLLVMGVKKSEEGDDVYDCIQTGRNGTLHFQLSVMTDGDSYQEHEFIYQPLLHEQRDRELIDLLPDYLTEEISFPRAQAPKFYTKVVDSMSKKIILEDD